MKRDFFRRTRHKLRRIQLNFKRMEFTLVGDAGRPWRKAMVISALVLAVLLIAVFGRHEVQLMSSPEVKTVEERGMIRIGVRNDIPGLSGEDSLERELARRVAQRVLPDADEESRVQFLDVTSLTACTKLDNGEIDLVIGMMSREMTSRYSYSSGYCTDDCILAVKAGTRSFELLNFTVGYIQSNKLRNSPEEVVLNSFLESNDSMNITKKQYASYDDLMMALMRGDVGGVVLSRLRFEQLSQQYDIVATSLVFGSIQYRAMSASDTSVFADIATLVIDEMGESGELAQLRAKYGLEQQ